MTDFKKVMKEFIELYRCLPCLWQIKNKDYHNRVKKKEAYKVLVEKLKEIEPNADKELVVRKINSLRSNIRKEKRRYEESLKSATSADDVHQIKLWYYDLLSFVNEPSALRESSPPRKLDSDDENSFQGEKIIIIPQQEYQDQSPESSDNDAWSVPGSSHSNLAGNIMQSGQRHDNSSHSLQSKRKRADNSSIREDFKHRHVTPEDRYDVTGKCIAIKLRSLDKKTALVTEKLINDLLFEAEIGNLTPDHANINIRDIFYPNQSTPIQEIKRE